MLLLEAIVRATFTVDASGAQPPSRMGQREGWTPSLEVSGFDRLEGDPPMLFLRLQDARLTLTD